MNNFTTELCLNSTFYFKRDIPILDLLLFSIWYFHQLTIPTLCEERQEDIYTRQRDKTVLKMKPQNQRPRITADVAR